ncbi:MAG: VRR-NUC domain-containing protein [Eubacteriales bacterium]|nr:VRR-NUC domain-containing protein [Eubacteriales bacterium]
MLEKDIVAAIMRWLRTVPHCFAWKEHGGMYGTAGVPDVICCLDGRFFAFEVKTPEGRLTKLQENTIQRIKDAGGHAFVVRSADDVKAVLWAYAGIEI